MLQFGYHIKLNELRANKLTNNSFNSLDGIKNSQLASYIYKKKSLSNYFKPSLKSENISVFLPMIIFIPLNLMVKNINIMRELKL